MSYIVRVHNDISKLPAQSVIVSQFMAPEHSYRQTLKHNPEVDVIKSAPKAYE